MIASNGNETTRICITPLPGPKRKRVVENDHKFMSPSYTRDYRWLPRRGHGAMSKTWTETPSWISLPALPSAPRAIAIPKSCAIQKQAAELDSHVRHTILLPKHAATRRALVGTLSGSEPRKAFFTNSGAEASRAPSSWRVSHQA